MKGWPLAMAMLLAAGGARAQDYGHNVPWDDEDAAATGVRGPITQTLLPRGSVRSGPMQIRTIRPACFLAAGFPVIRALIDPADTVESARVLFRPESFPLWYQVAMKRSGEGFLAVLPKPRPSAQRVRYVVEVTPLDHVPRRGREHSAPVVDEAAACGGAPAETAEAADIVVRVPRGAPAEPPVPPGFVPVGTVSARAPAHKSRGLAFIGAGFAGALAAIFTLPSNDRATAAVPEANEISLIRTVPPPGGHVSLTTGPTMQVVARVSTGRAVAPGVLRAVIYRAGLLNEPCGVLVLPHAGFPAHAIQQFTIAGPFVEARVCQPSDLLRLTFEESGTVIAGNDGDIPARYFIDP